MLIHVIGVVALALVFVIGTVGPVNIGALALIATFLIGSLVAHETTGQLLAGFPPELFVLLVGVTYLFGLAAANGTLEWLIDRISGVLGDRPALVPWLIFAFSSVPTLAGALGPAAVAMLAPLCLRLGQRYGLDRRMVALLILHGSCLGNFSPLNGLTVIVRKVAAANGLDVSVAQLFFGNAAYNLGLAVVIYLCFGGLARPGPRDAPLARQRGDEPDGADHGEREQSGEQGVRAGSAGSTTRTAAPPAPDREGLRTDQTVTLVAIVAVAVGALVFDLEIGFLALVAAALLHLCFPSRFHRADTRIVWSVVLLICGVVTLVGALQRYGTVDVVGSGIAALGTPLFIAYLLCLAAAVTSAFGSSAALLGLLIPLAAPFLVRGEVGVSATIVALSISATVVDSMPFSSVAALTLAATPEAERRRLFRTLLAWGSAMVATAPLITWLLFVLPSG